MRRRLAGVALLLAMIVIRASAASSDEQFLEDLERRSFQFFWDEANPDNGLIPDRAGADGQKKFPVASIASVGFGLAGICLADERGWIKHEDAYQRALTTLRYFADTLPHEHGFYYHFVNMKTGAREWNCELSSIDTTLLLAGVLTARQYYRGTEVEALATKIYERVDWPWMLNGGKTFSMGWTPESGFLGARWDGYSEHMLLQLLALGSPTHPVPPETWHAWRREPVITYAGQTYLQCPPLFTHQYSHAWIDFRNKRDAHADYWRNSVLATLAHRQFCIDTGYGENLWGISASDSATGYKAWGGPPATPGLDGTVVPCAAGGSIPFAPRECLAALRNMPRCRYGFPDAFNPKTGWVGPDVIGIDVGITLLMAENYRSGFVWREFMKNPEIQNALKLAGFRSTTPTLPKADRKYLRQLAQDTWRCIDSLIEPTTGLPYDNAHRGEFTSVSNIGLYLTDIVAARELKLISQRDAERRLARTLDSIRLLKTWHGFQQSWNSVLTLAPGSNDTWISVLDSGNLAGGLIAAGQAFPRFREPCRQLFEAMDWSAFYDKQRGQLWGGLNTATGKVNPDWHLGLLGADSRLAAFLTVATGAAPPEMWDRLDRGTETRHHATYLVPGWQGGGLFMQYINGLWLDDRHTFMGQSARNFAFAQMQHGTPWGWSASDSPSGQYLGWGALKDDIVTPHACALAIQDFPAEVVANLRLLEKMGARKKGLGFVDAIDVKTGQIADNFLVLDQSMLFLSLANFLKDDCVRRHFQADPVVQRGRQLIVDYREPAYGANTSVFTLQRRSNELRLAPQKSARARQGDWDAADWQTLGESRFAFTWDAEALRFRADVRDADVLNDREPAKIFEQDCVELFIDPANDALRWGDRADFQFGFAVADKRWEWFGSRQDFTATTQKSADGYRVEATIPWKLLGVVPAAGKTLQVTPAIHNAGHGKLEWNWQPTGDAIRLGSLVLE